jgi:hypothetical protein
MKVFNSSKYHYVGKEDNMYIFESNHKHKYDREVVKVYQAKMINPDGSAVYYNVDFTDSKDAQKSMLNRLQKYQTALTAEQRVCLTHSHRPTHTPKRSEAGSEVPVIFKKVNRQKKVCAL